VCLAIGSRAPKSTDELPLDTYPVEFVEIRRAKISEIHSPLRTVLWTVGLHGPKGQRSVPVFDVSCCLRALSLLAPNDARVADAGLGSDCVMLARLQRRHDCLVVFRATFEVRLKVALRHRPIDQRPHVGSRRLQFAAGANALTSLARWRVGAPLSILPMLGCRYSSVSPRTSRENHSSQYARQATGVPQRPVLPETPAGWKARWRRLQCLVSKEARHCRDRRRYGCRISGPTGGMPGDDLLRQRSTLAW
jgi:hypothetical protein